MLEHQSDEVCSFGLCVWSNVLAAVPDCGGWFDVLIDPFRQSNQKVEYVYMISFRRTISIIRLGIQDAAHDIVSESGFTCMTSSFRMAYVPVTHNLEFFWNLSGIYFVVSTIRSANISDSVLSFDHVIWSCVLFLLLPQDHHRAANLTSSALNADSTIKGDAHHRINHKQPLNEQSRK